MAASKQVAILCVLLLNAHSTAALLLADVVFGVVAALAAPYAVATVGFGTGGITAGSLAAKMMSVAWTTRVGVGVVGTLQSIGAAGMTVAQYVAVGAAGVVAAVWAA